MILSAFTLFHVVMSLAGIGAGLVVVQPRLNSCKSSNRKVALRSPLGLTMLLPKSFKMLWAKAADSLARLDIFVSNGGILTRGTIDSFGIDDFDRMVAVNIRGAFIGIQAARWRRNTHHASCGTGAAPDPNARPHQGKKSGRA